jgi:hypothetical protein
MDNLLSLKKASRGQACARGADIHRFGKLDEFSAGGIDTAQKDGYLQSNSG